MTSFGEPDDAWQTDVYLERLLVAHDRGREPGALGPAAARGSARVEAPPPDPAVRAAADLLERRLVRFHPSFRFEEALARRLRMAADRADTSETEVTIVPFPAAVRAPLASDVPLLGGAPAEVAQAARGRLFVGGAIASGVSLAGAALFAWRRVRPHGVAYGAAAASRRARPRAVTPRLGRVLGGGRRGNLT